jgi:chromosome segregation ATPase
MSELKSLLDEQAAKLKATSARNPHLRRRLRNLKWSTDKEIRELSDDKAELSRTVEQLQQNIRESTALVQQLKSDVNVAGKELRELERTAADSEMNLKSNHQRIVDDLRQQKIDVQNELNDHIRTLNSQIGIAAETIASNEAKIAKLQKQLEAAQHSVSDKAGQLREAQKSNDSHNSQILAQSRSEKEDLIQTYESTLSELKAQCASHRMDFEALSRELTEAQDRNRKAKTAIRSLKRERLQLQNQIQTLIAHNERDNQVHQAMVKNAQLSAESAIARKAQDAKAEIQEERRRIFCFAADEFRAFFNPGEAIDGRAYRSLLGRVRNELKRLADTDLAVRRLVGAGPRQSTDDAVAQLLEPK